MLYIILIVFAFFCYCLYFRIKDNKRDQCDVYFGIPGTGKSTMAAYLSKHSKKKNGVYSNVPITGTYKLEPREDLGVNEIVDATIIIDEASIEFNNRDYKTFPATAIHFFKYHRHYQCSVNVFSQDFEDFDITIRRLASRYFLMSKSFIPFFVKRKAIGRKIDIDENTKQIIYAYYWVPFGTKYIFCPPLWKMFNTISRPQLPKKEFVKW